jgi:hypothetical protein
MLENDHEEGPNAAGGALENPVSERAVDEIALFHYEPKTP